MTAFQNRNDTHMSAPSSAYIAGRIPKLPPKALFWLIPLLTSIIMSGTVSLVATLRGMGWVDGVLRAWLGNWASGWLVAFPVLFVVMPMVKRLTALLVRQP